MNLGRHLNLRNWLRNWEIKLDNSLFSLFAMNITFVSRNVGLLFPHTHLTHMPTPQGGVWQMCNSWAKQAKHLAWVEMEWSDGHKLKWVHAQGLFEPLNPGTEMQLQWWINSDFLSGVFFLFNVTYAYCTPTGWWGWKVGGLHSYKELTVQWEKQIYKQVSF